MKTVSLVIDGKNVEANEDMKLLQAASSVGIDIPHLCHDDTLKPYGGCRLCIVEIEKNDRKKLVTSCCYPVEEGLLVHTKTDRIIAIRKLLIELLLAISPSGAHATLAKEYGVYKTRFRTEESQEAPCDLCGLCVRYCSEIKKNNAVCFVGRGIHRSVALVPGVSDICSSCRECFTVCDAGKMVYLVEMIQEISCPPLKSMYTK